MGKVAGNFDYNGWSETVEERLKTILINYRCHNSNQSVLYRGIKTLAKAYNEANHDPDLYARTIKNHLTEICAETFESSVVEATVVMHPNSTFTIEIGVAVLENGKRYDLHSVLKSNDGYLFNEYDKSYFDFKF